MRSSKKGREHRSGLPPVQRIELSEEHIRMRTIGLIILIVIALAAFAIGVAQCSKQEKGWQVISLPSGEGNCSQELSLRYCLGEGELSVKAEHAQLQSIYYDLCTKAYRVFHEQEPFEGVNNLYYLNQHPNQTVTVDAVLYQALDKMVQKGGRALYLAPLYVEYSAMFGCVYDHELAEYDPLLNEEAAAYFARVCAFANNDNAVHLELLGNNQVRLTVSAEYQAFATENGITSYVDFFWTKNAFVVDYIAQGLIANGKTYGVLSSYDGFSRNLDSQSGTEYSYNVLDRREGKAAVAATLKSAGAASMVFFRTYPITELDALHYYVTEAGELRHPYIDSSDGLGRAALSGLTGYSNTLGCADIMLSMMPVYIADTLDAEALNALTEQGIYSIYCNGTEVRYNQKDARLSNFLSDDDFSYYGVYVGG